MYNEYTITGSLLEAYIFCPRQAWLMSRQITGNQYNEFLAIGRLISEESYKREKKEIIIDGGKIDIVHVDKTTLMLIEVKKSSKLINTAKTQLLYYMWNLKLKGFNVKGEIRVPKEKKIITVELTRDEESRLTKLIEDVENLLTKEKPPVVEFKRKCKNCSYSEFCWS